MEMAEGLAFHPRDDELVDLFLHRKLAGKAPLAAACFIHDVDVYSAAPDQLVAGVTPAPGTGLGDARVWYFFSPVRHCAGKRKARTIGADVKQWWHSEAGQNTVQGSDAAGCFQKFSFKVKTASGVVKPGWLMVEYSIGAADLVLCKVYRSPRAAPPRSRVSSSSTTAAALSESSGCCKKRKAEEEHPEAPPPCSARRQTTDEEEDDDAFAESLEHALMSEPDDHYPAEEAPPPCSVRRQTMTDEEGDDDVLLFAESLERTLTSVYHDGPGGEPPADDHHPAEEPPPPCSARWQTTEEEDDDVLLFAESLESSLTSEYHHGPGGEPDDHHPAKEPPPPCSARRQTMTDEEEHQLFEMLERDGAAIPLQPFEFDERDLMSVDGDMSALMPFDFDELDLFGGEPGAPPPSAPPAEPEPDGDAAMGLVQTTATVHGPCPDEAVQVADPCLDDEEGVQLDEPAPGEFISGLPCPPFDPAFIKELISTSGDVITLWPAVPAAVSRLCGGDHLSSASLRTGSFGTSPAVC